MNNKILIILFIIKVNCISQEVIKYDASNSIINKRLNCIAVDSSNSVIVGNDNGIIYKFNGKWEVKDSIIINNVNCNITDIEVSTNGTIWASIFKPSNEIRLIYKKNQIWENVFLEYHLMVPNDLFIVNDSTVYFTLINNWGNTQGADAIGLYSNDSVKIILNDDYYFISGIAPIDTNVILFSSLSYGILKYDGKNVITINPENWQPTNIKKIQNQIFVYGERLSKYVDQGYFDYPQIDSVLLMDSSKITTILIEGEDKIWLGTDKGKLIKYSEDIEVFKLSDYAIKDINIDRYKNKWFISYDGCFEFNENEIVGVKIENRLPTQCSLEQNYPNPFNPLTKINFSLTSGNHTKIIIYDNLGREITKLVNEYKNTGNYEAEFNAENLSSGIYYYKLTSGKYSETKKMILLK